MGQDRALEGAAETLATLDTEITGLRAALAA